MQGRHDILILVGRALLGLIFVTSGFGKPTNLDGFAASLAKNGVPMSGALAILGAAVEFFGGMAIVLAAIPATSRVTRSTCMDPRFLIIPAVDAVAFRGQCRVTCYDRESHAAHSRHQ